ncbi:MAG: hypothetical protein LBI90_10455 [Treponema sp.]|jgi:hypothetical protein|nr:hypothetical protein [Treponema sp.]
MTIEQTVEIPASHRLTIEVPPEIPAGRATIVVIAGSNRLLWRSGDQEPDEAKQRRFSPKEAVEKCWGIAKKSGLSSDRFLEMKRKDKEREDAKYRRMFRHEDSN